MSRSARRSALLTGQGWVRRTLSGPTAALVWCQALVMAARSEAEFAGADPPQDAAAFRRCIAEADRAVPELRSSHPLETLGPKTRRDLLGPKAAIAMVDELLPLAKSLTAEAFRSELEQVVARFTNRRPDNEAYEGAGPLEEATLTAPADQKTLHVERWHDESPLDDEDGIIDSGPVEEMSAEQRAAAVARSFTTTALLLDASSGTREQGSTRSDLPAVATLQAETGPLDPCQPASAVTSPAALRPLPPALRRPHMPAAAFSSDAPTGSSTSERSPPNHEPAHAGVPGAVEGRHSEAAAAEPDDQALPAITAAASSRWANEDSWEALDSTEGRFLLGSHLTGENPDHGVAAPARPSWGVPRFPDEAETWRPSTPATTFTTDEARAVEHSADPDSHPGDRDERADRRASREGFVFRNLHPGRWRIAAASAGVVVSVVAAWLFVDLGTASNAAPQAGAPGTPPTRSGIVPPLVSQPGPGTLPSLGPPAETVDTAGTIPVPGANSAGAATASAPPAGDPAKAISSGAPATSTALDPSTVHEATAAVSRSVGVSQEQLDILERQLHDAGGEIDGLTAHLQVATSEVEAQRREAAEARAANDRATARALEDRAVADSLRADLATARERISELEKLVRAQIVSGGKPAGNDKSGPVGKAATTASIPPQHRQNVSTGGVDGTSPAITEADRRDTYNRSLPCLLVHVERGQTWRDIASLIRVPLNEFYILNNNVLTLDPYNPASGRGDKDGRYGPDQPIRQGGWLWIPPTVPDLAYFGVRPPSEQELAMLRHTGFGCAAQDVAKRLAEAGLRSR